MPSPDPDIQTTDTVTTTAAASDSLHLSSWATKAQPWQRTVSHEIDAPTARGVERLAWRGVPPFMHGMKPEPRAVLPGYDSSVMTLLIVVFMFMSVNFRSFSTFLQTYTRDLWSERRRDSFYDNHTLSETRVLVSLLLIATVSEGVLAFSMLNYNGMLGAASLFTSLMVVIAWAAGYYIAQLVVYNYVGFLFFDPDRTRQWVKGFNASQSLLGIALAGPALIVLFNPGTAPVIVGLSVVLYLAARIIFICKGFRLFYDNIGSLIYFILYLCTLEIIPLVLAYHGVWR